MLIYVNDEYLGIFQLVEVEKAKNRINIENDVLLLRMILIILRSLIILQLNLDRGITHLSIQILMMRVIY